MRELLKFFIGLPIGAAMLATACAILYIVGKVSTAVGIIQNMMPATTVDFMMAGFVGLVLVFLGLLATAGIVIGLYCLGDYILDRGE